MSGEPSGWDVEAHRLWSAGRRHQAIQRMLVPINELAKMPPKPLLAQFAYYLFLLPDYRAATDVLARANKLYPDDLQVHLNLATSQSRAKDYLAAIATAEAYISKGGNDPAIFDMLAHSHYRVGRFDEARRAGESALAIKDQEASAPAGMALNRAPADVNRKRKVIAFSLWGSNPRYLRGALHNALAAANVYPGWICRYYVDSSVDRDLLAALADLGHEIVDHPVAAMPQRLSRRFTVADDPAVGRFLVRDCDSVVSEREARAVEEWVAGSHPFHIMRDWWTHTDPVLAGMWGGTTGVLPSMESLLASYRSKHLETPNWDQWFLRDSVWPLVRDAALIHDRCFASRNAVPFPGGTPPGNLHVGQDEFAVRRKAQAKLLERFKASVPSLQL